MEAIVVFVAIGGLAYAYVAWQQKQSQATREAVTQGRLIHLRSAAFPATCSWCKSTGLAQRLLVFEYANDRWSPYDVRVGLATTPDQALEQSVFAIFERPNPRWRRFCTEKCTREFFAAEHIDAAIAFGPCAYCSTRFPMTLLNCPHCGAGRRDN